MNLINILYVLKMCSSEPFQKNISCWPGNLRFRESTPDHHLKGLYIFYFLIASFNCFKMAVIFNF